MFLSDDINLFKSDSESHWSNTDDSELQHIGKALLLGSLFKAHNVVFIPGWFVYSWTAALQIASRAFEQPAGKRRKTSAVSAVCLLDNGSWNPVLISFNGIKTWWNGTVVLSVNSHRAQEKRTARAREIAQKDFRVFHSLEHSKHDVHGTPAVIKGGKADIKLCCPPAVFPPIHHDMNLSNRLCVAHFSPWSISRHETKKWQSAAIAVALLLVTEAQLKARGKLWKLNASNTLIMSCSQLLLSANRVANGESTEIHFSKEECRKDSFGRFPLETLSIKVQTC